MSTQPLSIVARAMNRRKAELAEREQRELKRHLRARGVECYMTVSEVATALSVSTETVLRQFAGREGVIDLGIGERMHTRGKRLLRIPQHVYEAYIAERQVKVRRR